MLLFGIYNKGKINMIKKNIRGVDFFIRENTYDEKTIISNFQNQYRKYINIEDNDSWLDAGGNVGAFVICHLPKKIKCVTIEPHIETYEILKKNIELNHYEYTTVINVALVENDDKYREFYISPSHSGGNTLIQTRGREIKEVKTVNINTILKQYNINKIKMDIEGYEYKLIPIMDFSNIKFFILEFHHTMIKDNNNSKYKEIITILKNNFSKVEYKENRKGNWTTIIACSKEG